MAACTRPRGAIFLLQEPHKELLHCLGSKESNRYSKKSDKKVPTETIRSNTGATFPLLLEGCSQPSR